VGNFDHVFEHVYQQSYLPFLECLARHPRVRLGLHYTGPLLEWLEAHHPDYLDRVRAIVASGQVEIVGGGFYEPILISIPRRDQIEQITRMREYLAQRIGKAPSGAWLAERVWEPQLPEPLQAAGVEYTILDDVHFLSAGFELDQLHGYYLAEERGSKVKVIPGLKAMRYMVPFQPVPDTVNFLRSVAEQHPDGMVAMGDDMEKFGAWPETHVHCYKNGWLDHFFGELEANSDWLLATPASEYLETHPPLGRADLPAASYTEMMEWVLPTAARAQLHSIEQEFRSRGDVQRFLRGGIWRGFLSKYPEVNLLHKKALHVSKKLDRARPGAKDNGAAARDARTHLLRAQCNDAYWHGVFGGLYSPHLRTECWRELIRAEVAANGSSAKNAKIQIQKMDFDSDGADDFYVTSPEFAALVKPNDGATIPMLDYRPSAVAVVNSMCRRPEAYHSRLAEAGRTQGSDVVSIHDQTRVKEPGLEKLLRYDRWCKHSFRVLVFSPNKTHADYAELKLEEDAAIASGNYQLSGQSRAQLRFAAADDSAGAGDSWYAGIRLGLEKIFSFESKNGKALIRCGLNLSHDSKAPVKCRVGVENVVNFLAPDVPDRYFANGAAKHPLNCSQQMDEARVLVVDKWQDVAVQIAGSGSPNTWIAPIETVSESEEGFERVYQGSQILTVWDVELEPGKSWSREVTLEISKASA
jgi:hypothetical protein